MSKTDLKIVESGEPIEKDSQESPEPLNEFTEELLPVSVDVGSFEARIAGIEQCSLAREIAKHCSTMAAFDVKQEKIRREREKLPPLTYQEEDELLKEAWRTRVSKRKEDYDEHLQFIMRRPTRFIDWGDGRFKFSPCRDNCLLLSVSRLFVHVLPIA